MSAYQQLKKIFARQSELHYILRLLMWDEAVMMPEGAESTRASAIATLSRSTQKMLITKKVGALLNEAKQLDHLSPWDAANLAWMQKKYRRASALPLKLVEQSTKAALAAEQAWRKLRPLNDWQGFLPYLSKSFAFVKEKAERRGAALGLTPYDALLDGFVPGFNQANIDPIFEQLKQSLPNDIKKIQAQGLLAPVQPEGPFPIDQQKQLALQIMSALQFDFKRGRLDVSHHPFCSGGPNDVRMTTRYNEGEFLTSLFAVCHETGHALYEQGLPQAWLNQPVGHIDSMAIHESQSLLIEMEVCRSHAFISYLLPLIKKTFGEQKALTEDNVYRLMMEVKPDFIRVDADEVTYPLHIILRYELEKALFKGEISLKELPEHWDALMTKYLGISTRDNFKDGVMQDVHWPSGAFGYFPAYTLGRLTAAQLFSSFRKQHPQYQDEFASGQFLPLINWLKQHVYSKAASLSLNELLQEVSGEILNPNYFLDRIRERY